MKQHDVVDNFLKQDKKINLKRNQKFNAFTPSYYKTNKKSVENSRE